LFLEPAASYQVTQQLAGASGLAASEQTLRSRLRERGLLVSTDLGRQMLTVRRTLERYPRQVLHLASDARRRPDCQQNSFRYLSLSGQS
jgi:hypothetical protein